MIAIILTIMVLELKLPHDASATALLERWPRVQRKNLVSLLTYASLVPLAFVWIWASLAIFGKGY